MPSVDGRRDVKAITLGHPSYVWRFGQDRRLAMIERYAPLEGRRILDTGCGVGMYVHAFRRFSSEVYGIDVDADKIAEASRDLRVRVRKASRRPLQARRSAMQIRLREPEPS